LAGGARRGGRRSPPPPLFASSSIPNLDPKTSRDPSQPLVTQCLIKTRNKQPTKQPTASELLRRSVAAVADAPAVFEAYLHVRVNAADEEATLAGKAEGATGGEAGTGGDNQNDDEEHAAAAAARRWYAARSFSAAGVVEGYYSRLPPPSDALVMRRPLS
jgi:hypothetical protein